MKLLFMLTTFFSLCCFSQQQGLKQLDELFHLLDDQNKAMGNIAIMKQGNFVYKNAIGYQYKTSQNKKKANENSKYRIGSITKVITATLIYQLLDEKKLSLEDELAKYFPNIPNAKKIKISNLINHSSGLFNITEEPDFQNWMLKPSTQDQMLTRIKKHEVLFQPGEKNAYSNTNYIILGYIIEKIENKSYAKVLKNRIVDKLQLKNTYYGNAINIENNECQSYHYKNNKLKPATETHMSNPGGAGGVVSTPKDLSIFMNALFTNKLISQKSFEYMITSTSNSFCNGIMTIQQDGQTIYGHGGAIDGFNSFLLFVPATQTAIAVTLNASDYSAQPIVFHALDATNGKSFEMPNFNKLELTEAEVKRYEGVYECKDLPFDLNFVAQGNVLKAGPDSKQLKKLTPIGEHEFTLQAMGFKLRFNLENETLLFDDSVGEPKLLTKK